MSEIAVSIVEDDDEFRESLALLISGSAGFRCISRYRNGAEAMAALRTDHPDVVLMDIQMPAVSGIECLKVLKPDMPDTQFVMVTSYSDDELLFESLQSGAIGYLLKRSAPAEILHAIADAHSGGSPMSSYIARRVVQSFAGSNSAKLSPDHAPTSLSPREEEILTLLSKGFLYKEIADHLSISIETVRTHLRRTYDKLQVRSRTEAVVKYLNR